MKAPALQGDGRERRIRYVLGGLLVFGGLNALGGGYYGLAGAEGVPTDWLAGSAFDSYLVPSLILLLGVGGAFTLAAVAVFRRWPSATVLAFCASVVVFGWLLVQLAILGFVSWMQPVTAALGVLILVLASRLERNTSQQAPSSLQRRSAASR